MRLSSLPLLLGLLAAAIAPWASPRRRAPAGPTRSSRSPPRRSGTRSSGGSQEALDLLEDLDDLRAEDQDLWHLLRVMAHNNSPRAGRDPRGAHPRLEAALAAGCRLAARPEGA